MSLAFVICAIVATAVSGLPGLVWARTGRGGERLAALLMVLGTGLGLTGAALVLLGAPAAPWVRFPWPAAGDGVLGVDALSAFFLVPVLLMGGLGAVYGLGYWPQHQHPSNGRKLRAFWGLLVAGMTLLVISRHALAFIFGWEVMAFAAFFLVATEDQRLESRRAGYLYLIATHVGTLALFALFALWRHATGSYLLVPLAGDTLSLGLMNGLFLLALFAFGLKAGMMPLHFWLPGAHANAPSHVSAMLSGVVLKMGIYGLVRWLALFPTPPVVWGGLILALGAVSGLLGVVFALGQHDLKRLLAYHSVENIGIILMGLGLAVLGRALHQPVWQVLGLAGCLLHVWNHAFFKSLLFLCAGAVVQRTHTHEIDRLGGLAKRMPWTAAMFLLGAVAICGLPPLNGFVSEWLVYLGLLRSFIDHDGGGAAVLAVPVLAMIGALAVACFVKVYGAVFLGTPRTAAAAHAREAPRTMRAPMLVLGAACAVIGLAPVLVAPLLDRVLAAWHLPTDLPAPLLASVSALPAVAALAIVLAVVIGALLLLQAQGVRVAPRALTWDCGYARGSSRIQYTASSFALSIIGFFAWVLRPHQHRPRIYGAFPKPTALATHVDDLVLERWLYPLGAALTRWATWCHRFQQGLTQHYVLYILLTVVLLLGTLIPFQTLLVQWLAR